MNYVIHVHYVLVHFKQVLSSSLSTVLFMYIKMQRLMRTNMKIRCVPEW